MSFADTVVLFVLALLLFGPKKLPMIAKQIGKALNEFKRASNELKNTLDEEIRIEEQRSTEKQRAPEPARPQPVDHREDDEQSVPRRSAGDA